MLKKITSQLSLLLVISSLVFSVSCANRLAPLSGVPEVSISDYENMVIAKTKKTEIYEGLYNKLTVQTTWLDSSMTEAALSHNARIAQWNETKYKEEKAKKIGKNAESTDFFVSIYTPERKHTDLSASKNLWKIYLDVGGQRYEGTAKKIKSLLTEIQVIYPHHNRWSTPYTISFPVATALVEGKESVVTFTGAVGTAQLNYK